MMDPNSNLEQQKKLACHILQELDCERKPSCDDVARLAELVIALDGWIHRGGFLPKAWQQEVD